MSRCGVVALAALLIACPGRLEDPGQFLVTCPAGFNVETSLFVQTCGSAACHTASTLAGGLDLVSPNPASRLIRRSSSGCAGRTLVSGPDSGFLFEKISGTPSCGSRMPLGKPALTKEEIECVVLWAAAYFDGGGP